MTYGNRTSSRSVLAEMAVALLAVTLLAAACGGKKLKSESNNNGEPSKDLTSTGESGLAAAGKPVRGGKLIYGLEAETGGGYCLAEGQLAISGIQVAKAFYDTLTVPNDKGVYVPYLAKSVSHDPSYKTWTIIRSGVKFSDGSALDGPGREEQPRRLPRQVPGPLVAPVRVRAEQRRLSRDAGHVDRGRQDDQAVGGIPRLPLQLRASRHHGPGPTGDKKTCDRKLIGTGPFIFDSWQVGTVLKGHRNSHYWQIAPDGQPYPYLNSIEFRPIPEEAQRANVLQSGTINMMHTSSADDIGGTLKQLQKDGKINNYVTQKFTEVAYQMLNSSQPPFNDIRMRQAMAMGADRNDINNINNNGLPTVADGPFAPGSVGYLKNPGFPKYNLDKAKSLVQAYVKGGGKAQFTLSSANDPETLRLAALIQERAKQVGVTVKIKPAEQAALINDAIGGKFQAITWRNHPGGDPDTQYVWWYNGNPDPKAVANPVNFGRINDPVIDKLLDQGRSEPDPAKRKTIYENLNREFAKKVWNLWAWFTPWEVAEAKNVHGILGPPLPNGDTPNPGLAVGHSLIGIWIS